MRFFGAGSGNRTRILSMARIHNSHYTIPAYLYSALAKITPVQKYILILYKFLGIAIVYFDD